MLLQKLSLWRIAMIGLLLCIGLPLFSLAQATADKTAKTGDWHRANTWTPTGMPGDGDVILIPEGETVTIRGTDHTLNNAVMIIEGELIMESTCWYCADYGSLTFTGEDSGVIIEDGGEVTDGTAFGGDTHFIDVQGETVWSGDNCSSNCGTIEGNYTPSGESTAMPASLSNPLPVEMLYFSGNYENKSVQLEWATASETNNSHFDIERAVDGFEFEKIGEVQGAGNSTKQIQYVFEDYQRSSEKGSIFYYRLRQEDFDGQYEYSKTIAIFNEVAELLNVWPSPFKDQINISINANKSELLNVKLWDAKGNIRLLRTYNTTKGKNTLKVNNLGELPSGIYFMGLWSNSLQHRQKLIKH